MANKTNTYQVILGPNYYPGACGFLGNLVSNNEGLCVANLQPEDLVEITGMMAAFQNAQSTPLNITAFMKDMAEVVEKYKLRLKFVS